MFLLTLFSLSGFHSSAGNSPFSWDICIRSWWKISRWVAANKGKSKSSGKNDPRNLRTNFEIDRGRFGRGTPTWRRAQKYLTQSTLPPSFEYSSDVWEEGSRIVRIRRDGHVVYLYSYHPLELRIEVDGRIWMDDGEERAERLRMAENWEWMRYVRAQYRRLRLIWWWYGSTGDFVCTICADFGTTGIPIWLLSAPILVPTLHSSVFRDPSTVNSGFRRNSVGIPE